jgi:uncharacterized protein DUF6166
MEWSSFLSICEVYRGLFPLPPLFYHNQNQHMITKNALEKFPVDVHLMGDFRTKAVTINGLPLKPEESHEVLNISPGFAWGYGGDAPQQLAIAILDRLVGPATALKLYQDLTHGYIAGLPQRDFNVHINLRWVISTIVELGPFQAVKQTVHV